MAAKTRRRKADGEFQKLDQTNHTEIQGWTDLTHKRGDNKTGCTSGWAAVTGHVTHMKTELTKH